MARCKIQCHGGGVPLLSHGYCSMQILPHGIEQGIRARGP